MKVHLSLPPPLYDPCLLGVFTWTQSFKYVGTEITWVGEGVEEYGHTKDDPDNVVVRVDPRYFRPTEVELLLVSVSKYEMNTSVIHPLHVILRPCKLDENKRGRVEMGSLIWGEVECVWYYGTMSWNRDIPNYPFVPFAQGDCSKAKKELGWVPEITFQELVKDMMKSDIANVDAGNEHS